MFEEYKWVVQDTAGSAKYWNGIDFSGNIKYAKRYFTKANAIRTIKNNNLTSACIHYATCRTPYEAVHLCSECTACENKTIADYEMVVGIETLYGGHTNMRVKKFVCEEHSDMVCGDREVFSMVELHQN